MNEERIKKELKGLAKAKPPRDFLYQVHSRLEEQPKQFALPLKLASTVATLIIIFSVYKFAQPQYQMNFKAPGTKMEEGVRESLAIKAKAETKAKAEVLGNRAVSKMKVAAKPKTKVKKELVSVAAAPTEMGDSMMGAGAVSESNETGVDQADIEKVKYIISLADGKVIYVRSNYIIAEIPNHKKESFIKMISQFDFVQKPSIVKAEENSVQYRIKLSPQK